MHEIGIIGLGAMGLASAWAANRKGVSVIGFDQFARGHASGSSHGETRMIRRIYSEGALYLPLLDRAYQLWPDVETEAGETLFIETGGLDIGVAGSAFVTDALACAEASGQDFDVLDAGALRSRYPALAVSDDMMALFAPGSGYLLSDAANTAFGRLAEAKGASLNWDCAVDRVEILDDGYRLHTVNGTYDVERLINAAGPWGGLFHAGLDQALTVERQVIGWFDGPADTPPFQRAFTGGDRVYALPGATPGRWKLALYHHRKETGQAYRETVPVDAIDRALIANQLQAILPECSPPDDFGVCRFTNTRDGRFILDRSETGEVLIAACSGHGYKFAPAIGEAAVALALNETPHLDLSEFTMARQTKL
ncbi:N-methyl-L-tryptophan oxidase [Hyphobacterium sp.]|uniref:N-methyl-L-tryptophan oxidase n=1 Tax=Hyphobacterium sp. TaxID=2004662 RepID=UPI003BAD3DBB